MIRAVTDTVIDAPLEEIYAQVADHAHWEAWLPMHAGWPDGPPDSVEQGARFRQRLGHLGIYDTVLFTVVENAAPTKLVLHGQGNHGANARLTFRLQPGPADSTTVSAEVEVIGKLIGPVNRLAKLGLQTQLRSSMRELEQRLHARNAT
jgi:hypothetical protein